MKAYENNFDSVRLHCGFPHITLTAALVTQFPQCCNFKKLMKTLTVAFSTRTLGLADA